MKNQRLKKGHKRVTLAANRGIMWHHEGVGKTGWSACKYWRLGSKMGVCEKVPNCIRKPSLYPSELRGRIRVFTDVLACLATVITQARSVTKRSHSSRARKVTGVSRSNKHHPSRTSKNVCSIHNSLGKVKRLRPDGRVAAARAPPRPVAAGADTERTEYHQQWDVK